MVGSEVPVRLADVLPLAGLWVGDLDVRCEVLIAPVGRDFSPKTTKKISVEVHDEESLKVAYKAW